MLDLGLVSAECIFTVTFWASLVAQPAVLELGRSPGGGNGSPLQYSCLGNPVDRGAWRATVHRVAESDTTERPTLFSLQYSTVWLYLLLDSGIVSTEHI